MNDQCELFLVELVSAQTLIGFVFLSASEKNVIEKSYQLGYLLAQQCWGQDIASELLEYFIVWYETTVVSTSSSLQCRPLTKTR